MPIDQNLRATALTDLAALYAGNIKRVINQLPDNYTDAQFIAAIANAMAENARIAASYARRFEEQFDVEFAETCQTTTDEMSEMGKELLDPNIEATETLAE